MNNFINDAIRTESVVKSDSCSGLMRLLHASMGLCTEAGEFQDALKKSIFYNKPLDVTNLKEELGDILWYIAIAMHDLDTDFEQEMNRVIAKLKHRYPDKYSDDYAQNRDLVGERKVLEE